jgi:hypothetical protein
MANSCMFSLMLKPSVFTLNLKECTASCRLVMKFGKQLKNAIWLHKEASSVPNRLFWKSVILLSCRTHRTEQFMPSLAKSFMPTWTAPMFINSYFLSFAYATSEGVIIRRSVSPVVAGVVNSSTLNWWLSNNSKVSSFIYLSEFKLWD